MRLYPVLCIPEAQVLVVDWSLDPLDEQDVLPANFFSASFFLRTSPLAFRRPKRRSLEIFVMSRRDMGEEDGRHQRSIGLLLAYR